MKSSGIEQLITKLDTGNIERILYVYSLDYTGQVRPNWHDMLNTGKENMYFIISTLSYIALMSVVFINMALWGAVTPGQFPLLIHPSTLKAYHKRSDKPLNNHKNLKSELTTSDKISNTEHIFYVQFDGWKLHQI